MDQDLRGEYPAAANALCVTTTPGVSMMSVWKRPIQRENVKVISHSSETQCPDMGSRSRLCHGVDISVALTVFAFTMS